MFTLFTCQSAVCVCRKPILTILQATANVHFAYRGLDKFYNSHSPSEFRFTFVHIPFEREKQPNYSGEIHPVSSFARRVSLENIAFPISRKMRKYTIMQIFRSRAVPRSQERMLREAFRPKGQIEAEHSDFISIN